MFKSSYTSVSRRTTDGVYDKTTHKGTLRVIGVWWGRFVFFFIQSFSFLLYTYQSSETYWMWFRHDFYLLTQCVTNPFFQTWSATRFSSFQLERKAVSRVSSTLTRMTDWMTGERNANFKLEVYTKGCRSNQSFACTKNHEGDNASLCHTVANSATRCIHHAWWIPVLRRQYQKELNFSRLYKPSCLLAHDTLEEEKRDSDPGRPSIHPS